MSHPRANNCQRYYSARMPGHSELPVAANPLRILVLSWRDEHHPEAGGAEIFLHRTTTYLAARGHDVTIQSARFPGSLARESVDGRQVVRRGGRYTVYPRGLRAALGASRRYDVIIDVHNGVPFWTPLVTRVPVISLVHHVHREQWNEVFDPRRARFGWWLESRAAPAVYRRSRYVTVSETTRHDLTSLGVDRDRIDVVYSGLDRSLPPNVPATPSPPTLVVLGRLVPHKRVEIAIETLAHLLPEMPDVQLEILGHGYWAGELSRRAQELGVSDRVRLAGYVSEQEKADVLARSRLALLPSLKEGWGLAILEAGAQGTATVAFRDAGGVVEAIVDGSTGVLVDSVEEFHNTVRDLMMDDERRKRLSAHAIAHASQFTWERSAAELEEILLSYCRRR